MLLLFVLVALCSAQWLHRAQLWREDVARRMRNQFGAPKSALGSWSAPTLFVPGHTLSASSWDKAVAMGTRGGNGAFAAVFSGRDNRFHISGADGRVLSDREAASTRMFIVDFKDVFASAKEKSLQIIAAAKALQRVLGGGGPVRVNVVTHSAGDFDFDTAVQSKALDNVLSVNVRVAIGPVFDGTYVGTLGGSILSRLGGAGRRLGAEAARELAENSAQIEKLKQDQIRMSSGFYRNSRRYDIMTNGLVGLTPRLSSRSMGAGDGFVQDSQRRPFAQAFVVDALDPTALNHFAQPSYRGVLEKLNELLSKN